MAFTDLGPRSGWTAAGGGSSIVTPDHGEDDDEQQRETPADADGDVQHVGGGHRSVARIVARRV